MKPNKDRGWISNWSKNGKDYAIYGRVKFDPVPLDNFIFMTNQFLNFYFRHVLRDFENALTVKTYELGKQDILLFMSMPSLHLLMTLAP
jgi:hypothetical protein